MDRLREKVKKYLSWEIAIEYKACMYFSCNLFFYCVYLMCHKIFDADIFHLFEIILTAYFVGYVQVYLFRNFDEAERLGKHGMCSIAFCIFLYAVSSWLFGWFDKSPVVEALYCAYMLFCYLCVFVCNKVKRAIDTENLNKMLTEFKKGGGS